MRECPIIISDADILRLRGLLSARLDRARLDEAHLEELQDELDRAVVLPAHEVPHGVVTMGSLIQIRDLGSGRIEAFHLVYPHEADAAEHRVSVLAPLGTALLGNSEGDTVEWRMPGGTRCFRIQRVVHEPAAAATQERTAVRGVDAAQAEVA